MMTRNLVTLGKCLNEMGVGDLEGVKDRISTQKKIYCLWISGIDLGFRFSWDLYGVYSESLGRSLNLYTGSRGEIDAVLSDYHFKEGVKDKLKKVNALINMPSEMKSGDGTNIDEKIWLELLTSIHFLATDAGDKNFTDLVDNLTLRENVGKELLSAKPHLKDCKKNLPSVWDHLASHLS